jgi:hypothetical protein
MLRLSGGPWCFIYIVYSRAPRGAATVADHSPDKLGG